MRWHLFLTHPTYWLIPYFLFLCGITPCLATFFKKKNKVTTVNNVITLPPGFCQTGTCASNGAFVPNGVLPNTNNALPAGIVGPNGIVSGFPSNGNVNTNTNTNTNTNNIFQSVLNTMMNTNVNPNGPSAASSLPLSPSTSGNTPITVFAFQLLQLGQITFTSATTAIIVVQRTSDGGIICPQTQPILASSLTSSSTTVVRNRPLLTSQNPVVINQPPTLVVSMNPNLNDPLNDNALPLTNTPTNPIVSTTTSILPVFTTIPTTITSTTTLFLPASTSIPNTNPLDPYQQEALPNNLTPMNAGPNQGTSTNPF